VSFTTDLWSDPDQKSYMAVTAHWLELAHLQGGQKKITIRADLVGLSMFLGTILGIGWLKLSFLSLAEWGLQKR
jgi:hypothetical protein